mmetsp:Transcript_18648/g.70542  ORF Transcript_18648/g.70542 Transcript_18648/m.70542 type:complete len:386 (+) Transcript_18648:1987-3144(+)
MIAPDHAGTQELVDARLRPAIEVPTNHYWKTPTEDEVLQFLRQCEGLPQLHVREILVAVQMGIGNAQLHRRGQLPLMRRREKLQNRDLRDVVLHQPGEEGVLFSIGKVEGLGLSIRRLVELDGIVLAEAEAAPPPEGGAAVDFAGGAHGFPGLLLVDALEPHVAEQRAPVLFVVICLNLLQADDVRPRVADFPQEVLPAVLPRERPIVAVGIRLLGGVDLRKHVVRDHPHALPGAVVDPRHGQQLPLRNRRWHGEHRLGPDDLRAVEVLPVRLPDGADLHSQTASDIHLRGNVGTVRAHELPALFFVAAVFGLQLHCAQHRRARLQVLLGSLRRRAEHRVALPVLRPRRAEAVRSAERESPARLVELEAGHALQSVALGRVGAPV